MTDKSTHGSTRPALTQTLEAKLANPASAQSRNASITGTITDHTGAALPCPLRTLTGVPCPMPGTVKDSSATSPDAFRQAWCAAPSTWSVTVGAECRPSTFAHCFTSSACQGIDPRDRQHLLFRTVGPVRLIGFLQ